MGKTTRCVQDLTDKELIEAYGLLKMNSMLADSRYGFPPGASSMEILVGEFKRRIQKLEDGMSNPITDEEWTAFEKGLKEHDWYHENADDHRSYLAGRKAQKLLHGQMQKLIKVDPARTRELFKRYAPESFIYPYEEKA